MINRYHATNDVWLFEMVEEVPVDQLLIVEQKYLNAHYGQPLCMNINPIAAKPPSRKGIKLTSEQRDHLKKRVIRDRAAWIEKLRITSTGRVKSASTREKLRAARLGKKTGIVSQSAFKKGHVPWNKGKPHPTARVYAKKYNCPYKWGTPERYRWMMDNVPVYKAKRA